MVNCSKNTACFVLNKNKQSPLKISGLKVRNIPEPEIVDWGGVYTWFNKAPKLPQA